MAGGRQEHVPSGGRSWFTFLSPFLYLAVLQPGSVSLSDSSCSPCIVLCDSYGRISPFQSFNIEINK